MTSDRKKPGVAFWAIVVVVPVLLYPITFGPACWLGDRGMIPEFIPRFIYRPLAAFLVRCCPNPVVMEMAAYGRWGSGLPLLYVASFGPACWLADLQHGAWTPVWKTYYPLAVAAERGPVWLIDCFVAYGGWGSPPEPLPSGAIPIAVEMSAQASYQASWHKP